MSQSLKSYLTCSDIKRINQEKGGLFFEKGKDAFHKTRFISNSIYQGKGGIFFLMLNTPEGIKPYHSVWQFVPATGRIICETPKNYNTESLQDAREYAKGLASGNIPARDPNNY